jgi:hypothetical protein
MAPRERLFVRELVPADMGATLRLPEIVEFRNELSDRPIAPCSWKPKEPEVESSKHQDNANIHCQPFPESVSEEREIYTDYDGYRHHVKHDSYPSAHFGVTPLMVRTDISPDRDNPSHSFTQDSRYCGWRWRAQKRTAAYAALWTIFLGKNQVAGLP